MASSTTRNSARSGSATAPSTGGSPRGDCTSYPRRVRRGAHGPHSARALDGGRPRPPSAVLSHAAAGALWDLRPSAATRIDITVRRSGRATRAGLRIHRPRDLPTDQTTTRDGIPVTTPARTILDLAATLQPRSLERLLDSAQNARLTDVPSLVALARAHTGHRGASKMLKTLDAHEPGTTLTRSELEEQHDFVFPDHRLVVEIDSWTYHRSRRAFETDRYRDQTLLVAGYRTLRITDTQLELDPHGVGATVRAALG
jgi:hypothetical protein